MIKRIIKLYLKFVITMYFVIGLLMLVKCIIKIIKGFA